MSDDHRTGSAMPNSGQQRHDYQPDSCQPNSNKPAGIQPDGCQPASFKPARYQSASLQSAMLQPDNFQPTSCNPAWQTPSASPSGGKRAADAWLQADTAAPAQATSPSRQQQGADALLALALLVLGFFFWEWQVLNPFQAGIGTTLFFLLALGLVFAYLQFKHIKQSLSSVAAAAVAVLGALPFALNGPSGITAPLVCMEAALCLAWVACSCKTLLARRLTLLLAADALTQGAIAPFANFGRLFSALFARGASENKARHGKLRVLGLAALGVVACVPVMAVVLVLLVRSDASFAQATQGIWHWLLELDALQVATWAWELLLGIPVACYIFGSAFANANRRHTGHLDAARLDQGFMRQHVVPKAAVYAPLALLLAVYCSYFAIMWGYLFAALGNSLPDGYSYAEYARQGFFELCGAAVVNGAVLAAAWWITSRQGAARPLGLRLLGGALALFTIMLVIIAASKMLLYVDAYGISPLRLYTLAFMLMLLAAFSTLLAWHLVRFNAARVVIVAVLCMSLATGLANTNGLVASYNSERYLSGRVEHVDVSMIAAMGPAARPSLEALAESAEDIGVREQASRYIAQQTQPKHWYNWNLQHFASDRLSREQSA